MHPPIPTHRRYYEGTWNWSVLIKLRNPSLPTTTITRGTIPASKLRQTSAKSPAHKMAGGGGESASDIGLLCIYPQICYSPLDERGCGLLHWFHSSSRSWDILCRPTLWLCQRRGVMYMHCKNLETFQIHFVAICIHSCVQASARPSQ